MKEILIAVNELNQVVRYFNHEIDLYYHANNLFNWYRFCAENQHLSFYRITYIYPVDWSLRPVNIEALIEHPGSDLEAYNIRMAVDDYNRI